MKKIYGKNKLSNSDRWIENAEKRQISALLLYKMTAKDTSSLVRKTANFNLPVRYRRDETWKIESDKVVFICFTSDFLLQDADPWRGKCWQMMRQRKDLCFYFFTKRIERFM